MPVPTPPRNCRGRHGIRRVGHGRARVVICRVGPPGAPSPGQPPRTRRDLPGRSAVGEGCWGGLPGRLLREAAAG